MLAHEIGQAVEAARRRIGMSIDELARSTSLDAALLGSIERGDQLASTAKLDRIASTLGLDAFALYGGHAVERALVVLPRHAARSDFEHKDLPVLRRALDRAAALREVSAILGGKSLVDDFAPEPPGAEPAQDGYHCARRVRKALGRITEPLDSLETLVAESFDIPVVTAPLATRTLLAAAVRSPTTRSAAIVLNPAVEDGPLSGTFQAWLVDRVSICHELCHILFDAPQGDVIDVVLDDPPHEGQERPPIEQRAGAFAAEMLIPLFGLKQLLGQEGRQTDTPAKADEMIDQVREHFRTPVEIAVNHLYNHAYIAKVANFRKDLIERAKGREPVEPPVPPVIDGDAWRLVLYARTREANERGLVTDGAARTLLELPAGQPLPWERDAA